MREALSDRSRSRSHSRSRSGTAAGREGEMPGHLGAPTVSPLGGLATSPKGPRGQLTTDPTELEPANGAHELI